MHKAEEKQGCNTYKQTCESESSYIQKDQH